MRINDYLDRGVSPYHVIETVKERLNDAGFESIHMSSAEGLENGKYYIEIYGTALIAFRLNGGNVHIACAHSDYPCFRLKPSPDLGGEFGRVNTEPYGGMLRHTWFDRPLGLAGAVWKKGKDAYSPVMTLVDSEKPVFVIPSLAPHMDKDSGRRDADFQKEMMPLISTDSSENIISFIAELAGAKEDDILSFDLNLYPCEKAQTTGTDDSFILSRGLDNLASVFALTEAIAAEHDRDYTPLMCIFNNEEVGSMTKQGGDSNLLRDVLDAFCRSGKIKSIYSDGNFLISADGAHSFHPNYPEKADITSRAYAGKGIVLKTSAAQRYATSGKLSAVIRGICSEKSIPLQVQANRSGNPGGSTLGPILTSHVSIPGADMGIPMLAMHSARETASLRDIEDFYRFFLEIL